MNRGFVAAGTSILTEEAFVHNLNSRYRTTRCDHCLLNPTKLYKCSGCFYVFYCGAQCQTAAWLEHKHECAKIRTLETKDIPDGMRMMAKIVLKLHQGGYATKSYYSKTESRKFRDLMTHEKEIQEDSTRMAYFETCMVPFLTNFFDDLVSVPSVKELLCIYGKMAVNSFNVLDEDLNSIGTGMYLAASILDHSCRPNAVASFEGRTLHIRTISDMPYVNWDQIFISYIDLMDDTWTRRNSLKKNYYFYCACPKCVDHDREEEEMYAAQCPKCKGQYSVEKRTCHANCRVASEKFVQEYQDVTEMSKMKVAEMSNTAYLDVAKICLKKQENILHPLNILRIKMLDLAFESAITMTRFEEAAEFGRILLPGFIKYQGDRNPLVGILLLKLGKILIYMEKKVEAEDNLREAERILRITHGTTSCVYRNNLVPLLQSALFNS